MLKRRSLGFKTPAYERIPILNGDLQTFDDQNMTLMRPTSFRFSRVKDGFSTLKGINPPYYVTMFKKTGFVERRINGLVNPMNYPLLRQNV